MIKESKFSKYLLYAIGEIVLVVLGILIALQINNWNEGRKTQLTAQVYINGIINDLESDIQNLEALIKRGIDYKENIENYLTYFNQGNVPIDKLIEKSKGVEAFYLIYDPVNNTSLDMQSSGNTKLLNVTQRNALIDLSSAQERLMNIIEKIVNSTISEDDKKMQYLGYPDNFFEKTGKTNSEENKLHGLLHINLMFNRKSQLYVYLETFGKGIIKKSKKTISILNGDGLK
jgi:hypothetical protein